jgi:hypothetical protein
MNFLLFVLVHLGIVYIVTQSRLFALPRKALIDLVKLNYAKRPWGAVALGFPVAVFICPPCFGFWVGGALQLLGYWPFAQVLYAPLEAAIAGCAIGATWGAWGPEDENETP